MADELSGKNAGKAIGNTILTYAGIILAIFAVAFWPVGIVAIILLGLGIVWSLKDQSKLKWVNIVLKAIFIIVAIIFMVMGLIS